MSEYEPDDSRTVTGSHARAPGEPPRTGPREGEARAAAGQQAEASQAEPNRGFATEGDSPQHPDRFSGGAAQDSESAQAEQSEDRWSEKSSDDDEDYVPEGK